MDDNTLAKNLLELAESQIETDKQVSELIDQYEQIVPAINQLGLSQKLTDVRLNKIEQKIKKIDESLPKTKSYDYLPIPKVGSGSKL